MVSFYGNAGGEGGGSGGTTNYNDLTNKPFINSVGTSANPTIIQNLSSGRYLISGYFKHGTDEPDDIAVPAGTKAEVIVGVDTVTGYKVAEYNTIENGDIIVNKILYKADGSLDKVEKINVGAGSGGDDVVELTQAEYNALPDTKNSDDKTYFITDGEGEGGGGSAELTSAMTTTQSIGGVEVGDTYAQGTSLETIIRDVLAPTLYPVFTNPSATLSVSGDKLLETGATAEKTFTITFNRGSINPAYGTSSYRAGEATGYSLNGGEAQQSESFTETVSSGNATFTGAVAYAAGEQPKNSSGANYEEPLAAGSVNTNTITYEFVNAMWANTANITSIAKLSLVSKSAKSRELQFPAQTVANPEVFDIPASWTVSAVEVKNDLSGAWENCASEFTVTDTTHNDAAGNSVAYKRYTDNRGFSAGARKIRVRWS